MKSCWIHIGMHKTGSTSIQAVLAAVRGSETWRYVRIDGHPNLNQAAFAMFDSDPQRHAMFVKQGLGAERLAKRREVLRGRLTKVLENCPDGTKVIISAEMISLIDAAGIREMRDFLVPWFNEIRIIGYVRPPMGFKNSIFQEQVKHGKGTFRNMSVPQYRFRFEKFDKVFGKENVILRKFDPARFPNHCIVADFCEQVGLPAPDPALVERVNESLSREACGILYAYRKFGPGYGVGKMVVRENNRIIAPLLAVRGDKFRFGQAIIRPGSPAESDDLSWMEARLEEALAEEMVEDGDEVNQEAELLKILRATCVEFVERFQEIEGVVVDSTRIPSGDPADPREVAGLVEHCRDLIRERMLEERLKAEALDRTPIKLIKRSCARFRNRVFDVLGLSRPYHTSTVESKTP
jgi:hypothetical protein